MRVHHKLYEYVPTHIRNYLIDYTKNPNHVARLDLDSCNLAKNYNNLMMHNDDLLLMTYQLDLTLNLVDSTTEKYITRWQNNALGLNPKNEYFSC